MLVSTQILGSEAAQRPTSPSTMARAAGPDYRGAVQDAWDGAGPTQGAASHPSSPRRAAGHRGDMRALALRDTAGILREAEELVSQKAPEDKCARVAAQLCARAYDVEPPTVLRMCRALGTAARGEGVRTASVRQELLRAADTLLQSLTMRLREVQGVALLAEVVETMAEVEVGTQVFFDMVMALVLAKHHCDCQALSLPVVLRLASAVGRAAASRLRLRPRGNGGPGTSTNMRVMEIIQQRIASKIDECGAEDIARLDDHFLARLCGEAERRAILVRAADLNAGFCGDSKRYLPDLVRLQQSVRRECPEGFLWSLPRHVRDYLEQLRLLGLQETAPWAAGLACSPRWQA
ncbi:unnamed protein product [Prorocentrum cordatum]|uniref:Uncharacterized protein n=1 Tax=Prorocentrum cordatum TaxID=2364126 RepID=A0ABN9UVN9_9DINO|nr:unnamed protein product [Polarella glacialis]